MDKFIYASGKKSLDFLNTKYIHLTDIQGISPMATVNCTEISGYNGASFVSSVTPMRTITIQLMISDPDGEQTKYRLYEVLALHKEGFLYYYSSKRQLKIGCYIEQVDIPPNVYPMVANITLVCPQPYWQSTQDLKIDMSGIIGGFEFPLEIVDNEFEMGVISPSSSTTIINNGELKIGCVFDIYATSEVIKPKITNTYSFEWLEVDVTLLAGDRLIVSTEQGNKTIKLNRNGIETNLINTLVWGSTFLQLDKGINELVLSAESGEKNMWTTCYYSEKYGGV